MTNNKKTSKIKKPNFILFFLCYLIVTPVFKFKYKTTYDRFGLSDLKGPALILCPHISNIDFILLGFP